MSFASTQADVQHGISTTKGCASPTPIGQPYLCSYSVRNNVDDAHDTLVVDSFNDLVHAASGNVPSGELIGDVSITTTDITNAQTGSVCYRAVRSGTDLSATTGSPTVTSATGAFTAADVGRQILIAGHQYQIAAVVNGTTLTLSSNYLDTTSTGLQWKIAFLDPTQDGDASGIGGAKGAYTNVSWCSLPFGSRINVLSHGFYTVQPLDFTLPGHVLSDDLSTGWRDQCNDPAATGNANCNPDPPVAGSGSQTTVAQLPSTTATSIHNAAHSVVTAVAVGTSVHDFVTVGGGAGNPPPTGSVSVDWFLNGTCAGAPAVNSGSVGPLSPSGGSTSSFDATAFSFTVNTAGQRAFKAHYLGDPANPVYSASDGPCEPLNVVDANIQITPNGVNRVGQTHTFTAHVNINDGASVTNALDGTTINFSFNGGPPSLNCTTSGGTGSCSVTYTSALTGVDTVNASTTVSVGGVTLTRTTNGLAGNSGPATKQWVNARIHITPNATNAVGQPHTFTVLLEKDTGNPTGFVPAAGEHVDVTLTDAGGAVHSAPTGTCTNAGANTDANGQCTITFTSNSAGTVTGHATSTLSVAGSAAFTVQTNNVAPNGPNAVKTFVDANIQITPNGVNRVGAQHTFTAHVNVNDGTGFVPAPAGTTISFSFNGGPLSANCTTSSGTGSCSLTYSSAVTGVDTVRASTTVSVGGVTLTRTTDGTDSNSGPATKRWVNARITITANATNVVGQPHTFTVTLQQDIGDGAGFVAFPGQHVDVTLTDAVGAVHTAPTGTCTNAGTNTDAAGQCTITFTSNSAGTVTGHATATVSVATSASFTVATNGVAPNSGDAVKTFVNANIQISPATATNPVGTNHVLTITVNAIGGTIAAGPHTATASIVSGPGSFVPAVGGNTCSYTGGGATASCTVTITSAVSGTTVVSATSDIPVGGLTITRTTNTAVNTAASGSGNANKLWATARIRIAPNDANEIGQPHTFTVTVDQDNGGGFVGIQGAHVDFTLTSSLGAGAVLNAAASTCDDAGPNTNAQGQCTITFTSPTPGNVTGTATATVSVAGGSITLSTNGVAPNSGPAVKTFVDANIQITPATDTNPVGTPHVLTLHVNVNDGTGFANAPAGTSVSASVASGPGTITGSPCLTVGATGSCTVTLNSAVPGTSVIDGSVTLTVVTPNGNVTLTRTTNGTAGNSPSAQKLWADSAVRTDIHNASHVVITSATPGDVIHDKVFVTEAAGTPAAVPNPTGSVVFHRYTSLNCTGASVDQTVPLAADGTAESATFTVVDNMSYKADYSGDVNYPAHSGACEPLSVQTSICPSCPPPPCPAFPVFPGQGGGGGPCSINVLDVSIKGNLLEITMQNTSTGPATLNQFGITWPTSNGGLKSVSMNGYLYTGPTITGGSAMFTNAMLGPNANLTRTIAVGQSQKLRIIFEKPASTDASLYTSVAEFNTGCIINLFP